MKEQIELCDDGPECGLASPPSTVKERKNYPTLYIGGSGAKEIMKSCDMGDECTFTGRMTEKREHLNGGGTSCSFEITHCCGMSKKDEASEGKKEKVRFHGEKPKQP